MRVEGGGFEGEESLMIYRGFGFITANSPSPQTPNSLRREESRGRTVPRPRLLIFYASHSTTLVREGRRFGIERTGNEPLRRGADFRAQRKPPRIPRLPFFPPGVRVSVNPGNLAQNEFREGTSLSNRTRDTRCS